MTPAGAANQPATGGLFCICKPAMATFTGLSNAGFNLAGIVVKSLSIKWLFSIMTPMRFLVSSSCVRIARHASAVAAMARAMHRQVMLKPAAPAPHLQARRLPS